MGTEVKDATARQLPDPAGGRCAITLAPLRVPPRHLSPGCCERKEVGPNRAVVTASRVGGYSLKIIADYFGLRYSTICRIANVAEDSLQDSTSNSIVP